MNTDPPRKECLLATRDILDLLSENARNLTVNEAVAVMVNATANVIGATGRLHGPNQAEHTGKSFAGAMHTIERHLEETLENELGPGAIEQFNSSRFAAYLQFISVSRHNKGELVSLFPEQPRKEDNKHE